MDYQQVVTHMIAHPFLNQLFTKLEEAICVCNKSHDKRDSVEQFCIALSDFYGNLAKLYNKIDVRSLFIFYLYRRIKSGIKHQTEIARLIEEARKLQIFGGTMLCEIEFIGYDEQAAIKAEQVIEWLNSSELLNNLHVPIEECMRMWRENDGVFTYDEFCELRESGSEHIYGLCAILDQFMDARKRFSEMWITITGTLNSYDVVYCFLQHRSVVSGITIDEIFGMAEICMCVQWVGFGNDEALGVWAVGNKNLNHLYRKVEDAVVEYQSRLTRSKNPSLKKFDKAYTEFSEYWVMLFGNVVGRTREIFSRHREHISNVKNNDIVRMIDRVIQKYPERYVPAAELICQQMQQNPDKFTEAERRRLQLVMKMVQK